MNVLTDSVTMLRRNLVHAVRYPGMTGFVIGIPVVLLLLFVHVFGGTLGAGLPGAGPGSSSERYLDYLVPGILLIAVAGTATGVSISVAQDMTEGVVARFRSMAVSRVAVLTGHVLGNTVQGLLCLAVVVAVAVATGLRPTADVGHWLLLTGFLAVVCFALSWVSVAMGMSARSVETASNTPVVFTLLPFIGSGFVPTASMPGWLQWFAAWQPFTPFIETTRTLLAGGSPGSDGWLALGWCAVLAVAGWAWSRRLYDRSSVR